MRRIIPLSGLLRPHSPGRRSRRTRTHLTHVTPPGRRTRTFHRHDDASRAPYPALQLSAKRTECAQVVALAFLYVKGGRGSGKNIADRKNIAALRGCAIALERSVASRARRQRPEGSALWSDASATNTRVAFARRQLLLRLSHELRWHPVQCRHGASLMGRSVTSASTARRHSIA